ncbi:histidine phosphatase family protein [Pelomonas sp. KK5]|uniref:histidine phosphatase family protein n=1 Tax=Pelomonas sp. KK5 TaxID=1855730 RepID=UPI00097BF296|nr:histidine phosphatase family protein [Pelomonas sp. KK5]
MGTLYLVRHGQASFGAADYDQLSPLGFQQCRLLGEYWRARGMQFDAVLTGSLKRHAQSFAGIVEGLGHAPEPLVWPGLNEYDSHAVIGALHPEPLHKPANAEEYRHHFRLLREGLAAWMQGRTQPVGMPSYAEFSAGVASALAHVLKTAAQGSRVLIVSSGGPISTAVGQILQTPAETTIELNLRIRNSSVTEFAFTPKRHMLVTYNGLPHLDFAEGAALVTYS